MLATSFVSSVPSRGYFDARTILSTHGVRLEGIAGAPKHPPLETEPTGVQSLEVLVRFILELNFI